MAWLHHSEQCQTQLRGNPRLLSKCCPQLDLEWDWGGGGAHFSCSPEEHYGQSGKKDFRTEKNVGREERNRVVLKDGTTPISTCTGGRPLKTSLVQGDRCREAWPLWRGCQERSWLTTKALTKNSGFILPHSASLPQGFSSLQETSSKLWFPGEQKRYLRWSSSHSSQHA